MRISLVIPTLWVNPSEVIVPMLQSVSGMYDELIIIDDTDIKLSEKLNKGLEKATGDLIVVSNDDVVLVEGELRDLWNDKEVSSPKVTGSMDKLFHAHMFAITKEQFKKVGLFDEKFPNAYWIDSDYWMRITKAGFGPIKNNNVVIEHNHAGTTLSTLNIKTEPGMPLFVEKHGQKALSIVQ